MSYLDALTTEVEESENEQSNTVTTARDSAGATLEVGTRVRVADSAAESLWELGLSPTVDNPRPFDFGTVEEVNDDGTVVVLWDAAGCACSAPLPTENGNDLTVATDSEDAIWSRGLNKGYSEGERENQEAIRNALGLTSNS